MQGFFMNKIDTCKGKKAIKLDLQIVLSRCPSLVLAKSRKLIQLYYSLFESLCCN